MFLGMLLIIITTCLVVTAVGKYISSLIFLSINQNLHTKVVDSLIRTKMSFFDQNTSGRIINRLSSDIKVLDVYVFEFLECIDYNIKCGMSVVIICISSPVTIINIIVQLIYVIWLAKKIFKVNTDTMRLKMVTNSPIVSLIQDSFNGQVTMRAVGTNQYFLERFFEHTDVQTATHITSNGINRFSAFRIDMQAYFMVTIFAAITLFSKPPESAGDLAFKTIGF